MWVLLTKVPWKDLQDPSRSPFGRNARMWGQVLVGVGLGLVVLWVVIRWVMPVWSRWRDRQRLFRKLVRAHGLEKDEVRLLFQLARKHRLSHPALLFVKKSLLDLEISHSDASAAKYSDLRNRLFSVSSAGEE